MTRLTVDSLRADWAILYRMLRKEKAMRRDYLKEPRRSQALAEINAAIEAAERIKDAAKAAIPQQQPLLIDAVRKKRANGY